MSVSFCNVLLTFQLYLPTPAHPFFFPGLFIIVVCSSHVQRFEPHNDCASQREGFRALHIYTCALLYYYFVAQREGLRALHIIILYHRGRASEHYIYIYTCALLYYYFVSPREGSEHYICIIIMLFCLSTAVQCIYCFLVFP